MTEANINWITDQVATGGDFSYNEDKAMRQITDLMEMEIDLIIDCRQEADDAEVWEQLGQEYLHLPTNDAHGWSIPPQHFDAAVGAARPVLEAGGRVFVHCHMGVNRGPSTAYALLLDQRMSATRAFDLIRTERPQAGLAYAEDALEAHLRRKNVERSNHQRRMTALRHHIDAVMSPEVQRSIQHVIRTGHQQDREDMRA